MPSTPSLALAEAVTITGRVGMRRTIKPMFFRADGVTPAEVDGPTQITITDPEVAEVMHMPGTDDVYLRFLQAGTTTGDVDADADLGEGVRPITIPIAITVTDPEAEEAKTGTVVVGPEVEDTPLPVVGLSVSTE